MYVHVYQQMHKKYTYVFQNMHAYSQTNHTSHELLYAALKKILLWSVCKYLVQYIYILAYQTCGPTPPCDEDQKSCGFNAILVISNSEPQFSQIDATCFVRGTHQPFLQYDVYMCNYTYMCSMMLVNIANFQQNLLTYFVLLDGLSQQDTHPSTTIHKLRQNIRVNSTKRVCIDMYRP